MSKKIVMTDIFGTRKYKGERLGIEVELENVSDPDRGFEQIEGKQFWTMVHDGSLRNNGVEYLTNPPFKYDELPEVLEQLETIINAVPDSRATCRTGLHVHVNVSDMAVEQVRNMILLSVLYEPGLIWHCGEDRASNIYSLASSQGDFILGHINQMMHGDSNRFGHHVIGCRELKYSSLNIGAISQKGTLEYRMHRGTKSSQDIGKWVDILVGIRRIACEAESPDHIINGIEMLRERAADIGLSPSSITRRSERRANLLLIPNVECPRFSESPTTRDRNKEWEAMFVGTAVADAGLRYIWADEAGRPRDTNTEEETQGRRLFDEVDRAPAADVGRILPNLTRAINTPLRRYDYESVIGRHGGELTRPSVVHTGTTTTINITTVERLRAAIIRQHGRCSSRYGAGV